MSKVRVIHLFLKSCLNCPDIVQQHDFYCNKYNQMICTYGEVKDFFKMERFPHFCKLIEIEEHEVTIEENKNNEQNND